MSLTAVHIFTTLRQILSSEHLNIYCNFSTTCLIYFKIYILCSVLTCALIHMEAVHGDINQTVMVQMYADPVWRWLSLLYK